MKKFVFGSADGSKWVPVEKVLSGKTGKKSTANRRLAGAVDPRTYDPTAGVLARRALAHYKKLVKRRLSRPKNTPFEEKILADITRGDGVHIQALSSLDNRSSESPFSLDKRSGKSLVKK